MKPYDISVLVLTAFLTGMAASLVIVPPQVVPMPVPVRIEVPAVAEEPACDFMSATACTLSPEQQEWMKALAICESSDDPHRVNEIDRDGTPSYGLYQFKPGTLSHYMRAYDFVPLSPEETIATGAIYDRALQESIVAYMIKSEGIPWEREFPGCVRKLGVPPRS